MEGLHEKLVEDQEKIWGKLALSELHVLHDARMLLSLVILQQMTTKTPTFFEILMLHNANSTHNIFVQGFPETCTLFQGFIYLFISL